MHISCSNAAWQEFVISPGKFIFELCEAQNLSLRMSVGPGKNKQTSVTIINGCQLLSLTISNVLMMQYWMECHAILPDADCCEGIHHYFLFLRKRFHLNAEICRNFNLNKQDVVDLIWPQSTNLSRSSMFYPHFSMKSFSIWSKLYIHLVRCKA